MRRRSIPRRRGRIGIGERLEFRDDHPHQARSDPLSFLRPDIDPRFSHLQGLDLAGLVELDHFRIAAAPGELSLGTGEQLDLIPNEHVKLLPVQPQGGDDIGGVRRFHDPDAGIEHAHQRAQSGRNVVLRGGHVDIQVGEVVVGIVRIGLADRLGVIALEFIDLLLVQVHHRVELDVELVHREERDGDDRQQGNDKRRRTAVRIEVERHIDDLGAVLVKADGIDIVDRRVRRLLLRIDTRQQRRPEQMREGHLVEGVVDLF